MLPFITITHTFPYHLLVIINSPHSTHGYIEKTLFLYVTFILYNTSIMFSVLQNFSLSHSSFMKNLYQNNGSSSSFPRARNMLQFFQQYLAHYTTYFTLPLLLLMSVLYFLFVVIKKTSKWVHGIII